MIVKPEKNWNFESPSKKDKRFNTLREFQNQEEPSFPLIYRSSNLFTARTGFLFRIAFDMVVVLSFAFKFAIGLHFFAKNAGSLLLNYIVSVHQLNEILRGCFGDFFVLTVTLLLVPLHQQWFGLFLGLLLLVFPLVQFALLTLGSRLLWNMNCTNTHRGLLFLWEG